MIISKIISADIVYYCVHAEQTVSSSFLDEQGQGIFEEILTKSTLVRIFDDLSNKKYETVILDFILIQGLQSNLNTIISSIKKEVTSLILINISSDLIKPLGVNIYENINNVIFSEEKYTLYHVSNDYNFDIDKISNMFFQEFTNFLTKHTKPAGEPIPHYSSSVYLNSYIDIKSMISGNKGFFFYSIYLLALKINSHWGKQIIDGNFTLLCQNLNSSYIASILSNLLRTDVLILDKIGPINKLYSNLDNKIVNDKNYLIVSDLICLGTEVKITKNLITYLGGNYLGNVSLVRIETMLPESKKITDIEYVYQISKTNNPIDYKIITALDL